MDGGAGDVAIKIFQRLEKVRPSEALFMFVAWLSCRKEIQTIGASEDCAPWPDLLKEFIEHNKLEDVRDNRYPGNLEHPPSA